MVLTPFPLISKQSNTTPHLSCSIIPQYCWGILVHFCSFCSKICAAVQSLTPLIVFIVSVLTSSVVHPYSLSPLCPKVYQHKDAICKTHPEGVVKGLWLKVQCRTETDFTNEHSIVKSISHLCSRFSSLSSSQLFLTSSLEPHLISFFVSLL